MYQQQQLGIQQQSQSQQQSQRYKKDGDNNKQQNKTKQRNNNNNKLDYEEEKRSIHEFLENYECAHPVHGLSYLKYHTMIEEIAKNDRSELKISLDDLVGWQSDEGEKSSILLENIRDNAWRYLSLFENVVDDLVESMGTKNRTAEEIRLLNVAEGSKPRRMVLEEHRKENSKKTTLRNNNNNNNNNNPAADGQQQNEQQQDDQDPLMQEEVENAKLPPALLRRYEISFIPRSKTKAVSMREVRSGQIGQLVNIRGICTRVSDVLPRVVVACYTCNKCGYEIYQQVTAKEFLPISTCPTRQCLEALGRAAAPPVHLKTKNSKFVKYQEIRIQELPDQVPIGNIPRSMSVIARGECTRQCHPGDIVDIAGIFLPEKPGGFKGLRFGLTSNTYLHCMNVVNTNKNYDELIKDGLSDEMDFRIRREVDLAMKSMQEAANHGNGSSNGSDSMYERLSRSVAPEIYGLHDVKKALLLQLVGGVTRELSDGMKIRGDINVCLMGDPGKAKSQLLKHISLLAPRAIYTTGKGSSGVGLTAAVNRDPTSGEMCLEGGALVLADNGICCIDEFDKMEESDRTAIHEVMEQQTVSIAKAGITTTLNARTAILAAANPQYGRYNKALSMQENINLPQALLSRFDLLFLILDKPDTESDMALAEHITSVHRLGRPPALNFETLDKSFVRAYIAAARRKTPVIPQPRSENITDEDIAYNERAKRITSHIIEAYVNLRKLDHEGVDGDHAKSSLTARQLLSVLRLAQSHARIRFANEVAEEDVDEALRLVTASKSSLNDDNQAFDPNTESDDNISRIFREICKMLKIAKKAAESDDDFDYENSEPVSVRYNDIEEKILRLGFSKEQLKRTLEEYSRDDTAVLYINKAGTRISFLDN